MLLICKLNLKILTIASRKGGAGKSTCAAHLAMEAVNQGLKVLLIDLDPQKTLEDWFLKKQDRENPVLLVIEPKKLQEIKKLEEFDLCIIDTPGDTSYAALSGIKCSDLVLIPTKATAPDLGAIGRTISMVEENFKPFLFLITQALPRSKSTEQAIAVLNDFGPTSPIPLSSRIAFASAMGLGISAIDSKAQLEIRAVWQFIESYLFSNIRVAV